MSHINSNEGARVETGSVAFGACASRRYISGPFFSQEPIEQRASSTLEVELLQHGLFPPDTICTPRVGGLVKEVRFLFFVLERHGLKERHGDKRWTVLHQETHTFLNNLTNKYFCETGDYLRYRL